MKGRTTKAFRVGCILLFIFLLFVFALFTQPARATNTVTITVGSKPYRVAVTPNSAYAYITNSGSDSVSVISTSSNTVTATVTGLNVPMGVAVTPNGAYTYVTNEGSSSNSVSVISTSSNTVTATVTGLSGPSEVAIMPNGAYAYVTNSASGAVSVINTATNTVTATITVGSHPDGIAITPNGAYAYVVNNGDGTVSVINTATNTVAATVTVGSGPWRVAITPNGAYAYVTNYGDGTVSVISTATNTVTRTITVGSEPVGVAVTPNGAYAYIANYGGGTVSVINTATNTVTATITVGSNPDGVAITPNGAYAYAVNNGDGTVSVINTLTVSALPSSHTMDVGQSTIFTATPSGGSGTYASYQWFVDGAAQSSQTASTFNYSPVSTGSYSIAATVTDSFGTTSAQSTAAAVTVNSAMVAPTVSASKSAVDQGQTSSLTSTAISTGTPPYTYQWLQKAPGAVSYSSISGYTSNSYSFVTSGSTTTGIWNFELQVTDSASNPAVVTSSAASVTISVVPAVSLSPISATLNVGESQTFTAIPSGGSGTYTSYQWYVDGSAQVGQTASTFSYSSTSAGSYSITVTVSDSFSTISAQSTAAPVTVSSIVTPTPTPIVTSTPTPRVTSAPTPTAASTPMVTSTPTPAVTSTPTPTIAPTQTTIKSNNGFPIGYLLMLAIPIAIVAALIVYKKFWSRTSKVTTPKQLSNTLAQGANESAVPLSQTKMSPRGSHKQIFISYVAENKKIVEQLAAEIEKTGFKTWFYDRDSIAGSSYITTEANAIKNSQALIVVVSQHSIKSSQVTKEVLYAHDIGKTFFPILYGMTYEDLKQKQEEWRIAFGSATSLEIPDHDVASIIPKLIKGLKTLDSKTK